MAAQGSKAHKREGMQGHQVEIVSSLLIWFRKLKQCHFLYILFGQAVPKVLPSFKEKGHGLYFLMGSVSKNLQTEQ